MNNSISNPQLCITILAGGMGSRMQSITPKVLQLVKNEPILVKLIKIIIKFEPCKILIIVNPLTIDEIRNTIKKYLPLNVCDNLLFIIQDKPQGTGHAVLKTIEFLSICKKIGAKHNMILNGDIPCIEYVTLVDAYINFLVNYKSGTQNLQIIGINLNNPEHNGRIMQDKNCIKIIEYKDCNEEEKLINQINTGIYIADIDLLINCITKISNKNKQNEYYLTDIVSIASQHKYNVILHTIDSDKKLEIFNVNTKEELNYINEKI